MGDNHRFASTVPPVLRVTIETANGVRRAFLWDRSNGPTGRNVHLFGKLVRLIDRRGGSIVEIICA